MKYWENAWRVASAASWFTGAVLSLISREMTPIVIGSLTALVLWPKGAREGEADPMDVWVLAVTRGRVEVQNLDGEVTLSSERLREVAGYEEGRTLQSFEAERVLRLAQEMTDVHNRALGLDPPDRN